MAHDPPDGIYDVPGQLLRSGDAGTSRFIGTQLEAMIGWQADQALALTASLSLFRPGEFIRQSGLERGKRNPTIVTFCLATGRLKFDGTKG